MRVLLNTYFNFTKQLGYLEDIPLLAIRLYLAPIFIQAGWTKWVAFESTVMWFGDPTHGLGLPFASLMASMAIGAELIGGCLILVGLLTRIVAIPLLVTMFVAAYTVHWNNGWLAIADSSSWFANGTISFNQNIMDSVEKKEKAMALLNEYGHYEWLTSSGPFVVLNNGIEFAATYFVMLLVLFVYGAGRFTSIDAWLVKLLTKEQNSV